LAGGNYPTREIVLGAIVDSPILIIIQRIANLRIYFNLGLQDGSNSENCDVDKVAFGALDVCTPKSCANDKDLYSIATLCKKLKIQGSPKVLAQLLFQQNTNF
jgi:hypothetical protein